MLSKTSSTTRFWRYAALIAFVAVAQVGCGGGGGGDNGGGGGGGNPAGPDTTAPTFGGLTSVRSQNGNVILTAKEGSDDVTAKPQLQYLIYVSETAPVDKSAAPHATFNGTSCTGGTCSFQINDLDKSGSKTFFFASQAKDAAGNIDKDAHPTEDAGLSVKPEQFTDPTNPTNDPTLPFASLNKDPGKDAVQPSLTVLNGTPYVMWEECTHVGDEVTPKPGGYAADHPCSIDAQSDIYMARLDTSGATPAWVRVSKDGKENLNINPARHSHSAALTADQTSVFASWKETLEKIRVGQFNGTQWNTTLPEFPDSGSRPALTRHPVLGEKLGIAYELSPNCQGCSNTQIFFNLLESGRWSGRNSLNVVTTQAAEAPAFSRNGNDLYMAWKEYVPQGTIPETTKTNVFVRQFSGGSWLPVSTSLNFNTSNEARIPAIDVLDNTPYVVWQECLDGQCNSEHIFVKHWDAGQNKWVQDKDTGICGTLADCGSLNYHSEGERQIPSIFAKNPSITTGGGKVTVVWSERDDSFNPPKYQIRRKTLTGNTWEFNGTLSTNNAHWPVIVSSGSTRYIAWTEKDPVTGVLQLHVAKQ